MDALEARSFSGAVLRVEAVLAILNETMEGILKTMSYDCTGNLSPPSLFMPSTIP